VVVAVPVPLGSAGVVVDVLVEVLVEVVEVLGVVVEVVLGGAAAADGVEAPRRESSLSAVGVMAATARRTQTTAIANRWARTARRSPGKRTTQRSYGSLALSSRPSCFGSTLVIRLPGGRD
jgi:hypothetical protein